MVTVPTLQTKNQNSNFNQSQVWLPMILNFIIVIYFNICYQKNCAEMKLSLVEADRFAHDWNRWRFALKKLGC